MKYNYVRQPCHPVNLVADALALALVIGLPLYLPNGYVGLIGSKFSLLLGCVAVALVSLAVAYLVGRHGKKTVRRMDAGFLWLVGLCCVYTIAWLFAEDRYTALWGLSGRKNGLVLLLACTAVYAIVTLYSSPGIVPLVSDVLMAVGSVVTLVSWLNFWMIDPLDAYYTFLPERGELFLGTVGNVNFYGALLCLCVPLAVGTYLRRGKHLVGGRFWVALWLCSGLIPCGSDASWLGCTIAVTVLCCSHKTTTHTLARVGALIAGLSFCAVFTRLMANVCQARTELRTVSAWLGMPVVGGTLLLAVLVCMVWWLRRPPQPCAKWVRGAALVVAVGIVLLIAAANLWQNGPGLLAPLQFNERWAQNRGYAWQKLWIIYTQDTTWWQKLIGLGADSVRQCLNPDVESTRYMILLNGEAFDSAHNEFLQHLVCGGLLGLLCWCGFLATVLWRSCQSRPILAAAILGYMVQSFFSISMPGVFPLIFVLAALTATAYAPRAEQNGRRLAGAAFLLFAAALMVPYLP